MGIYFKNKETNLKNILSKNKTPTKLLIINIAWANENPTRKGKNKNGTYNQYPDPNGKGNDVGPGLLVGKAISDKSNYTELELNDAVYNIGLQALNSIAESYNAKYGSPNMLTPFDTVSVAPKLLLLDTRYLNGRLPADNWPGLYQAIADGDFATALLQSRSTYKTPDGVVHYDNDRVRRRAESIFPNLFKVSYKLDSLELPVVTYK